MKVGDKVYIRGDCRKAGKYLPEQLIDGKYVKHAWKPEPWVGIVTKVDEVQQEALVGGGWRGFEMYELV